MKALRSGRSKVALDMSRSFRWTVSEPPSSEDLDLYPATTRRTPHTTPTPSIMKSHISESFTQQGILLGTPQFFRGGDLPRDHLFSDMGLLALRRDAAAFVRDHTPHGQHVDRLSSFRFQRQGEP